MEKRMVMFVMESQRNKQGEFRALIAVEGESGYYKTDWFWGTDLNDAEQIAKERNKRMNISEEDARKIVLSTMRKQRRFPI
jgi:hypothetical protein